MKKRLISMLLTVLMVMSLVTGMSVSAYADDTTDGVVEYTLSEGDFVLRLCQRQGINYFTCKDAIMKLNGIKSEAEFSRLAVGRVIKLPATDAAAAAISASGTTNSSSTSGSATTGVVTVAKGSDFVAYYLIPYTIQRGETVAGVCNALGISFNNYADQIMKLNNISSWNKVAAGKTLLLPSTKAPAVGTTCYQIIGHKVASGETAYNMCASYGIDYGGNTKLLQALNNSSNLAKIKAGSVFYMPAVTTIASSSTGSSGSTGSTGSSGNSGSTGSSDNSSSGGTGSTAAKKYSITPNINTAYGTMTFYVDNKAVSTAAAGEKVSVDVVTKNGKAIDGLTVKYASGNADLKLEGNTFIMPGCDVRVDAAIKAGYDIDIESNYSTKTAATVSGVSVTSASQGANVKIVSTDPGYMVESATVYYTTWLGIKKYVAVNDAMCFIMPADDVTVKATLKTVPTYNFYRTDCVNGSFDLQVDGFSASKAAKGAKVTIVWKAMDGYTLTGIEVTEAKSGKNISVLNNSFTMPGCDVNVELTFGSSDNAIVINAAEGGILRAYEWDVENDQIKDEMDPTAITEAPTGKVVFIQGSVYGGGGYNGDFNVTVTRNADGNLVKVKAVSGGYTFTMPAGGVTVDGQFIGEDKTVTVEFPTSSNNENAVTLNDTTILDNSADKTGKFAVGSRVELSTLARDGYAFTKFEIYAGAEYQTELSELANTQSYFPMPNSDITIKAIFTADAIALEPAEVKGSADVSFQVSTNGKDGDYQTANSCKVGDWVKVVVKPTKEGYVVPDNAILVTNKATEKSIKLVKPAGSDHYAFQMPAEGADIYIVLVGQVHKLSLRTVDANDASNVLQGKSLWQISINEDLPIVENKTAGSDVEACFNDQIVLSLTDVGAANYVVDRIELKSGSGTYAGGIEFQGKEYYFNMPDEDLTCTVYFREKTSNDIELTGLSYNAARGTAGFEVGGKAATACKVGDTVMVRAKALDGFYFTEDDVVITRADYGTLTKSSTLGEGNFQPVYDGTELVGWNFIMPKGGLVSVEVNFRVKESSKLLLEAYDENGDPQFGNGYIAISYDGIVKTDLSGDMGTAPTGTAVYVSLTDAGKSLFKLVKVTVDGIACAKNGEYYVFNMPSSDAKIEVSLETKNAEPEYYNILSSYDYSKGTVSYYVGDGSVTSAKENDDVKIVFAPAPGYMLDSYTITRNTDNVTINEEKDLAKDGYNCTQKMPADGITVAAKFVNKTFKTTIKLIDKDGNDITAENLIQVKVADGKYVAVKTGTVIETVFNNNVNISLTSTGKDYKITGYQIDSADEVKGDRSEFTLKIDKNGIATLTIRLTPKT